MKRAFSKKNLWEHSPRWVKSAAGAILGRVPPGRLLGGAFRRVYAFAQEADRWPAERARDHQLEEVRRIVALAYEKTAYYRHAFDAVGFEPGDMKTLDDLASLPTIDKRTLREHLDAMCAVPKGTRGVDYVSTGGSTGEPLRFYIGAGRSAVEFAYLAASWGRVGYRLHMPQAVFRGQIVAENRSGLRHQYDPILRRHEYSNFHMTDHNISRYLAHVATIGPCFLHVYPSSATTLARYVQRHPGTAPANLLGILAGSEMVLPDERRLAENVFHARYFSWYGHSEKLVLAAECERSSEYHVWPTYGYFELLDDDGRPVDEPGRRGEIVGTGFINTIVPFIRYRTGDFATYVADRCTQCGRDHPIIRDIEGRWPAGCLIAHDGSAISMTAFNVHDDTFDNVLAYQFVQAVPGEAILCVVPAKTLTESDRSQILRRASARLQNQVTLRLETRDALEQTLRGKQLRVVSMLEETIGEGPCDRSYRTIEAAN